MKERMKKKSDYVLAILNILKDVEETYDKADILEKSRKKMYDEDGKKKKVWDVVHGDTDGDVIGQVEGTKEEATILALDKYDPGWRERDEQEDYHDISEYREEDYEDEEEEEEEYHDTYHYSGYSRWDTWDLIYVREPMRKKKKQFKEE